MAGEYEPIVRWDRLCWGHVAAAVEDKVYVWGGCRNIFPPVSHDGPDKTDIILKVDILDVKVRNTPTCLSRIGFHSTRRFLAYKLMIVE